MNEKRFIPKISPTTRIRSIMSVFAVALALLVIFIIVQNSQNKPNNNQSQAGSQQSDQYTQKATINPTVSNSGWERGSFSLRNQSRTALRGLALSIPPGLISKQFNDSTITFMPVKSVKPQASGDFSVALTYEDLGTQSLQQVVDSFTLPGTSTGISNRQSVDPIEIRGHAGFRVVATGVGGNNFAVFLEDGKQVVIISASYIGTPNPTYGEQFDQMVDSINFK